MQANLCEHQKPDGTQCRCVANRDGKYCRHHARYYDPTDMPEGREDFTPPIPDHPESHLLAVHQATRAFLAGNIDAETCRLLIYAARVESNILRQQIDMDRIAHQRAREEKQELARQQNAEARAQAILAAVRERGYPNVVEVPKT